jgi:cytochrome c oxidase cbb3-type subunit 1
MQGLMWRAYDSHGFLQYSFIETVQAMHPYYVIRAMGGVLFLTGALVMVYNLIQTAKGRVRDEEPVALPAASESSRQTTKGGGNSPAAPARA